jgi:MYXO-CTERM domain-containing protein
LGIGGSGSFPDDYDPEDIERWLESTAGAAQGGASSLNPQDYEAGRSVDRGSCSVGAAGATHGDSYAWWMLLGLGTWLARRRKGERARGRLIA